MNADQSKESNLYIDSVSRLMCEVFQDTPFPSSYIAWLYRDNVDGIEFAADEWEGERLLGHYAIVPRAFVVAGNNMLFGLSLNTAVSKTARGRGLFTSLARQTFDKATKEGIDAIVGVANANSTPGFVRKLGFTLLGKLPVTIGIEAPIGRGASTFRITDDTLNAALANATSGMNWTTRSALEPQWSLDRLRYRLANPQGKYWVHNNDEGMIISTVQKERGVPIAVILKVFPKKDRRLLSRTLLRSACATHKTPFFLYAGTTRPLRWVGVPLPDRLRPSPLNLIYRPLSQRAPKGENVHITSLEFLDFDAY